MRETKVIAWSVPNDLLPNGLNETTVLNLNLYKQEILDHMGEGWDAVSHTVTPAENGTFLLTALVVRDYDVQAALDNDIPPLIGR